LSSTPATLAPGAATDLDSPGRTLRIWLARVLGALLALPAFKLLFPWPREASLQGDLFPEHTGAAIGALAAIPMFAVLYTLRRAPRPAWALLLVGVGVAAFLAAAQHPPTDTLEFDRWRLLAATCFAVALGGAALDSEGRKWFARASVVVACVALAPALADGEHQFSGVLGNTGSISEAALLGAGAGLGLALWDTSVWRWIGAACAASYAYYVGIAPVYAGAAAFAALLVALIAGSHSTRKLAFVSALLVATVFAAGRITPRGSPQGAPTPVGADAPVAGERTTGGFEVRSLIWRRVPSLLLDAGLAGVGPGQFAAAFPPFRDPREIELSSLGRRLPGQEIEVQHAHNDYLQVFSDAGPVGGLLFLALAVLGAWRAFRALSSGESGRAALALGLLGLLANGFVREPLTHNPVSATLGFAALGALCGGWTPRGGSAAHGHERPRLGDYALLVGASLAIALQVPRAVSLGLHGRALREYFEGAREPQRLAFLLDMRPDSVVASSLYARSLEQREGGAPSTATVEAWNAVLALRPHSLEALMQLGLAEARLGRVDAARDAWTHARTLDPGHPGLLRNLARLEARDGELELARSYLERLGAPPERAYRDYAVGALQDLDLERGWLLFGEVDERWRELDAERAHHFAREAGDGLSDAERLALEGSAHVAWARDHAQQGDATAAVRSYRQARRCLALDPASERPAWSRALTLEYAAALALAGQADQARLELGELRPSASELAKLQHWAGQALLDAGLLLR
jgi:O-antigen ligase/tetratricopeptide (TPR) repeat protein